MTPEGSVKIDFVRDEAKRAIFEVPLSSQRYDWVKSFIFAHSEISKISDFGCGNGRIYHWLKSIPHVTEINFIDSDDVMLEMEMDYHMRPGFLDLLFGRQNSKLELTVRICHGDIAIPDNRLLADCFLMIELIEHMHMENLERAVRTVFGFYQPKYVIVSTPNCEFNHLLNRDKSDLNKFRHYDHKFEWNRLEFTHWANNICSQFPYTCAFDGVGHLPNSEPFGPCTQIAIFTLLDNHKSSQQDRDLACFDAMLDKLNIRQDVYNCEVDKKQNRIVILNEFRLKGKEGDEQDDNVMEYDWSEK